MEGWETLERQATPPRLSIYNNGQVNWSRAVQTHLGDPDRVELRLDRENGQLAVRATEEEETYKVARAGSFTISARGALKRNGLLPEKTHRVRPELDTMQGKNVVLVDVKALLERIDE